LQIVIHWITRYGYAGVFSLLALGIFGIPIPDEMLLTFVGYLIFLGRFHKIPAVLSAFCGTACGITASYGLGRCFGGYILPRWSRSLHQGPERLGRAQGWLRDTGRWALTFGYFVPGMRHLTASIAGASNLPFSAFTLFAYTGGLLWCLTFIGLGYFLGEGWTSGGMQFEHNLGLLAGFVLSAILLSVWLRTKTLSKRSQSTAAGSLFRKL
jgi:membrane protein DedA with SNARE-associated domain